MGQHAGSALGTMQTLAPQSVAGPPLGYTPPIYRTDAARASRLHREGRRQLPAREFPRLRPRFKHLLPFSNRSSAKGPRMLRLAIAISLATSSVAFAQDMPAQWRLSSLKSAGLAMAPDKAVLVTSSSALRPDGKLLVTTFWRVKAPHDHVVKCFDIENPLDPRETSIGFCQQPLMGR